MDIALNFINQSNDTNNSQVVIFQKNVATNFNELAVAWHVIQNCGQGENHPFVFPMATQVSGVDSWGNYSARLNAEPGQQFGMVRDSSGDTLQYLGPATSPAEVQVLNNLTTGAISAGIYKSGKLLATKTGVAPQQHAVFAFGPTLWIGVASQVVEGQTIDSAILSNVNTELSLLGIASADIIMTGGGTGPTAQPFNFSLRNTVYA